MIKRIERVIYNPYFEWFILILVVLSVFMIILEKLIDIPVAAVRVIERIDIIILCIFAFEFFIKLFVRKKNYLTDEYGWVDFLSIIPLFASAVKALRGIRFLKGIRLLRTIRMLRILRILRFLKIFKHSDSILKRKLFLPISTAAMIIILLFGFLLISWQQNLNFRFNRTTYQDIFKRIRKNGAAQVIEENRQLLMVLKNGEILASAISLEAMNHQFLEDHLLEVTGKDLGMSDDFAPYKCVFLVKDAYTIVQRTELFVMGISILVIIALVMVLNQIISTIVLDPIAKLSETMDKVIYEVPIPNTNENRKEINFDVKVEYTNNDEIGFLAEKYNFLLKSLEVKISQSKSIFRRFVGTMMNLFGEFHNITKGHQIRSARLASALGFRLGLSEDERRSLFFGMLLHDLGKVGVDKNVLTKPGRFTSDEAKEMQRHPTIGFEIAKNFPLIDTQELTIIREHHEKIDGSGYPYGLEGDELSLISRISTVSDIFDALACPRDYKTAKSMSEVQKIMTSMCDAHIDKQVYHELEKMLTEGIIIVNPGKETSEEAWIVIDEQKLGARVDFE
ncbi:MAG: ion transporter [Spirochaetes bacterium]|nr:ion transporter [Spirochaetota bacterium]